MTTQEFQIRAGALMGVEDLLSELGANASYELRINGLDDGCLNDPEQLISFAGFESVLEQSAVRLGCRDFGMRLAQKQDLSMLGSIGMLVEQCVTIVDALRYARSYMSLHVRGEYWTIETAGSQAVITRFQHQHQRSSAGQGRELSLAVCYRLLKNMVGDDFYCTEVRFSHQGISPASVYSNYFDGAVSFNQEKDQVIFPSVFLDRPIAPFGDELRLDIQNRMDEQLAAFGSDIESQVRSLILQTLGSQEHSLKNVALLLHMHERTLQRKLARKGLNFKALLSQIRFDTASWLLQASRMEITFMSQMLGYSDVSAFSKSFKKTRGVSPRRWRQCQQTQD